MTAPAEVAVVGGGPAGAATAALLADAGHHVVLVERRRSWAWRACGVFSSPAAVDALRRVGVEEVKLRAAARPIPAMRLETCRGVRARLTYGDDGSLAAPAVGFDRAALDPALLALAASRGTDVRTGAAVRSLRFADGPAGSSCLDLETAGGPEALLARVVVGADGPRSLVALEAGVRRRPPLAERVGLTFHVADPDRSPHDARMVVIDGGYVGLAPVPGGRVNVGIVLDRRWRRRLRTEGAAGVAARVLDSLPASPVRAGQLQPCDRVVGAAPIASRVARRAGSGWLLVGDAAGFLDPFTGEGLHRAVVSAELAADAIDDLLRGRRKDLRAYERAMAARFATKDVVSRIVQAFLARPALFEYAARRLASRDDVRETMSLVIGDLAPASRALDPRFLAALLRP